VLIPWLIVVGDNDNMAVAKVLGIFLSPLTGATTVTGSNKSDAPQTQTVFFTLGYINSVLPADRGNDIWEAIYNRGDSFRVPNPAALTIRLALPEILRFISDYLIK
jgi:hypothetical protein